MTITIYLAGSVPKSNEEMSSFKNWREEYVEKLNLTEKCTFIDPVKDRVSETDIKGVYGKCCYDIKISDLIIVNAEQKMGLGTSQEMLIAKYFKKLVVSIAPKGSPQRKKDLAFENNIISDWIHPFLAANSDFIFESIDELVEKLDVVLSSLSQAKGIETIDSSISDYQKRYLKHE